MTNERRSAAIILRRRGYSIKSIAAQLHAAQSSVSIWVRSVGLTETQKRVLKNKMHSPESIEKRRQSRLKNELVKRNKVIDAARSEVNAISKRELWLIGTSLYWAEGSKRNSNVQFSNGDPNMILLMIRFFTEVCGVDKSKLKACIHIHEHLDVTAAERYWQTITGIPEERFYKTYNKPNRSSKGTRNSLPYGVCDIYVLNVHLLLRIKGWIKGIYDTTLEVVE